MSVVELIQFLQKMAQDHKKRIFLLRELAAWKKETRASIGMTLIRAEKKGVVFRVGNHWVNRIDPPKLLEIAQTVVSPSYLSFESALYHHNILSQSPRGALTMATLGRPRRFETPLGAIQFTHLKRSLFIGYNEKGIAHPEKAWLDLIYIRRKRGEVQISEEFYLEELNQKRLKAYSKKFPKSLSTSR